MKTYQLIDTSSYCNLHTKASISAKWAEKNEKDKKARHSVVNAGPIILITSVLFS